jgi:hypothetical protein
LWCVDAVAVPHLDYLQEHHHPDVDELAREFGRRSLFEGNARLWLHALLSNVLTVQQAGTPKPRSENESKRRPSAPAVAVMPPPPDGLIRECDVLLAQFTQVPLLRNALKQRDELQRQFDDAERAGVNFELVGKLGLQLNAVKMTITHIGWRLSESDYRTLFKRCTALVQRVTARCRALTAAKAYLEVMTLGSKLAALNALDLSILTSKTHAAGAPHIVQPQGYDSGDDDPVYVPPEFR